MIQDLHSHTYYSFCGQDTPQAVIAAAIEGKIDLLGICDHNYGIAGQRVETAFYNQDIRLLDYQRSIDRYLDHLRLLQNACRRKIKLLCGIEIATENQPHLLLPEEIDISHFDYCLIEHIDREHSVVGDLFAFAQRCGCKKVGVAHTDIPSYLERSGQNAFDFFSHMAQCNIFWELNVNYDSIHGYREHAYVQRFLTDKRLQEIILNSGVQLSVGFDGHRSAEYLPGRVRDCCKQLEALGIPLVFSKKGGD